jgi:hypothetical protein
MTPNLSELNDRINKLEMSLRRWRVLTATLCACVLVLLAAAFREAPAAQSLEAERITLRSVATLGAAARTRVDLSIGPSGDLRLQWSGMGMPELRLIDFRGNEISRLGPAKASRVSQ